MPNRYRQGTVTITLRIPAELREKLKRQAKSSKTSVNCGAGSKSSPKSPLRTRS